MLPIVFLAALVDDGPVARPSSQQVRWADMEIGMFIHFAPNTWQDREGDDLSTPLSRINPAKLDTDQWAQAASDLGAKYVVLVTKHVGGFCLWQTDTTDYGIKNSAWKGGKGDVVADLAASCRKRGLALGFYVSPMSLHDGTRVGGAIDDPAREKAYAERYRTQLEELLTRYGPVFEVWFDGNTHLPVGDVLDKFGPKAVCFQGPRASIRWVGNEEGVAPYPTWNSVQGAKATTGESVGSDGDPTGDRWLPAEVDVSIRRPYWFWSTKNESSLLTVDQLMEIYYRSVGHGANLLLNVPPNSDGLIPEADFARVKEFGDEVRRRFGRAVRSTKGQPIEFSKPTAVDTVVLMEDIRFGERVLGYRVEGLASGKWKLLADGTAIGHKRIQPIPTGSYSALRLVVTKSQGSAHIRFFAAYRTGVSAGP